MQEEKKVPKEIILSDTEKALYNFIRDSKELVTVDSIIKNLGKQYVGAIGRLIQYKKIERVKEKPASALEGQLVKYVKGYKVLEAREDIVNFAKDESAKASGDSSENR